MIGPSPAQVGGVATFVNMMLSSPILRGKYELIHLDITRGRLGAGMASRFALINILYLARQLVSLLWILIRHKPQIMHVPVTSFWAFWKDATFILLGKALGLKVIAHLHGGLFETYYRRSAPRVQRLIRWVLLQVDQIVALSGYWKRFLTELDSTLNVEIIPNTIEPLFVPIMARVVDKTFTGNTVLFVGQLGQHKGVFDILKSVPLVAKRRPDVRFVFAGRPETQQEWIDIERACAGLKESVQFLGQVTGQAKLDLFLKADVFVLPSYAENLPYSLLEAMAAGLPVISTPVGAIPEVVEEGQNGFLIHTGNHEELAEKLLLLLDDPILQRTMSQANQTKIKKGYLPEVAISQFDRIYKKVLGIAEVAEQEKVVSV